MVPPLLSPLFFFGDLTLKIKFLVRSRRTFTPRRRLTRTNRSHRLAVSARVNNAINPQGQPIIQSTVLEQIPPVQLSFTTLSPPLEISYSPISNPSLLSSADFPSHPSSPLPITQLPVPTPSTSYIQSNGYSPAAPLPLIFHDAQQLLDYFTYFTPFNQDQVIVRIAGSDGLFSVPIASLISLESFSFQPHDPTQY